MKTRQFLGGCLLVTALAPAQAAQFGDFTYASSETGITLTRYTGPGGAVTIPDTIDGLPVTSVGEGAFSGCTGLTSVTIPNSVTSVGEQAFLGCTGLSSVVIGNSVTSIGWRAFWGCSGLTSILIPDSVASIGQGAFGGCTGLSRVVIGNSVTSIGSEAFSDSTDLTDIEVRPLNPVYSSVDGVLFDEARTLLIVFPRGRSGEYAIPDSVASIGSAAFSGCTGLTGVTIPNSVTTIGSWAFSGCTGLTSVTIPNSVTSIERSAFFGCTGLTSVLIGNSVTSIGQLAFHGCTGLIGVTIPNSVTSIGPEAFSGCTGLTDIEVSPVNSAYSSVDGVLFDEARTLLIAYPRGKSGDYPIPDSVASIGSAAFSGCTGLTGVTIPDTVTSIGLGAFYGCTGLTSLVIGNSVTNIGRWAFRGCAGLARVVIPNSVLTIEESAFAGCRSLASLAIPEGVQTIEARAFRGCTSLTSVTIPNTVTQMASERPEAFGLESWTFAECTSLVHVTIGSGVPLIETGAFSGCTSLTSVSLPNGLTQIGERAFSGCASLTSIVLPDSVTKISSGAFDNCASLTEFFVPAAVTSIAEDHFMDAPNAPSFAGCSNLRAINVAPENPDYSSLDGVLFDKSRRKLIQYPGGKIAEYVIPESVTTLWIGAFRRCTGLTRVTIPSAVSAIQDCTLCYGVVVFDGCTNLAAIEVDPQNAHYSSLEGVLFTKNWRTLLRCPGGKSGVCTIPRQTTGIAHSLADCRYLTAIQVEPGSAQYSSVAGALLSKTGTEYYRCPPGKVGAYEIPGSVVRIAAGAFEGCQSLTSITIPDSVTSIDWGAFSGCTGLIEIAVDALNPAYSSQDEVLFNKARTILIQCPGGKTKSYTIPDSVTSIGEQAFSGCTGLTSVTIPDTIISIPSQAFWGCTGLTSVVVGDSVTSIEWGAFSGCTGLARVLFEGDTSSAWDDVFADTPTTIYYRPGTSGWAATVFDRPTALWLPLTLGEAPATSLGRLSLLTSSPPPAIVRVQRSTNLRDWEDWQPISRDAGPSELRDPDVSSAPYRFYRLSEE